MKTLYIIDASGFLYRSYFAIRNVTNAKGESTNALFGFIRSLLKLRKDFNPEHLIAVFDGPHGGKKREAIYEDYKAHRSETPPDLIYQIGWAREVCKLMGIAYLSIPEVEADDTIGSISKWAAQQSVKVFICTSDKDLCQMVDGNTSVLNTHKDNLVIGPKEVEEIFGVPPQQMIDFLAMTGDASDNVPGLPGIGPKTAATLLQQYGSLDYLLDNPQVVSGKKQEVFIQYAAQARLSRQLVTIYTDVDFPKEASFFAIEPGDVSKLKEFYASMNFNSLIRELENASAGSSETVLEVSKELGIEYSLVNDEGALDALCTYLSQHKEIGIAAIGTSPQPIPAELVGIAFSVKEKEAFYVPLNGQLSSQMVLNKLKVCLEDPRLHFFGHNVKYTDLLLENNGIKIAALSFDTMLASYLLNSHSRQHSLDYLMLENFKKMQMPLNNLTGKGKKTLSIFDVAPSQMLFYSCEAVDYTVRLKALFEQQMKERNLSALFNDLEMPLLSVLAKMERRGIFLDLPDLKTISHDITKQIAQIENSIFDLAGERFNLNSPKQLSDILFVKLGIKAPKKTATGLSTNAEVLESLAEQYPIAKKILEYRTLEKLRSTYVDSLPEDVFPKTQRIHCTFNQTVAATGRLSCQDPNLQNIPIRTEVGRTIRRAFHPQKEGWSFLAADYSQIELRLLAHMSEDPILIEAFQQGADIHAYTAAAVLNIPLQEVSKEQRNKAKAVNFGIVYGQQAFGLAQELGIDVKEAAAFIDAYFRRYPRVREYLDSRKELARQTGKTVTYTGRERLIPEIHSRNGQLRALAERLAVNTPLQGTAADLIKMAMLEVDKRMKSQKLTGFMILQVHDELIFEVPDSELEETAALVKEVMQNVLTLKIPLIVDIAIGKNWAEC